MAIRKIITGAALGAVAVLATPMLATASEPSLDEQVSSAIEARLNAAGGDTSNVTNVDIAVTPELIASAGGSAPDVLANYVVNEILAASEGPKQQVTPESTLSPMAEGSLNYTADEQVFIAAAGFAWINQDMKIATQNGSFAGAELVGSSYMTGIAFGQWNPNWSERYYNLALTCVSTTMNGTYSAVVKGSPINFAADVTAYDMWQNGGMVSSTAADCGMS